MSRTRNKSGRRADTPRYLPTPAQIAEGCRLARAARFDRPPVEEESADDELKEEVMAHRAAMKRKPKSRKEKNV